MFLQFLENSPSNITATEFVYRLIERCKQELVFKDEQWHEFINAVVTFGHDKGYTALCYAVEKENKHITELLVLNGADVNLKL